MDMERNPQLEEDVMEQIARWKATIRWRCKCTETALTEDRLVHTVLEGFVYILANPIVGTRECYDDFGNVISTSPRWNMEWHFSLNLGVRS
jgi:hypothetical protein